MRQTTASWEFIIALRRKRGEQNITTEELATQAGVSSRTVRELLNSDGKRPTRPGTIAKLNEWLYQRV